MPRPRVFAGWYVLERQTDKKSDEPAFIKVRLTQNEARLLMAGLVFTLGFRSIEWSNDQTAEGVTQWR